MLCMFILLTCSCVLWFGLFYIIGCLNYRLWMYQTPVASCHGEVAKAADVAGAQSYYITYDMFNMCMYTCMHIYIYIYICSY